MLTDWQASASGKDGYIKTAVETLPRDAWENQTPESLLGTMQGMLNKISVDSEAVVVGNLAPSGCH